MVIAGVILFSLLVKESKTIYFQLGVEVLSLACTRLVTHDSHNFILCNGAVDDALFSCGKWNGFVSNFMQT